MGQTASSTPTALPEIALHVLKVSENSPADGLLEPFFDYLVGIQDGSGKQPGQEVPTPRELQNILERNQGKEISLFVYNAKTQRVRGECSECPTPASGGQDASFVHELTPAQRLASPQHPTGNRRTSPKPRSSEPVFESAIPPLRLRTYGTSSRFLNPAQLR